MRALMEAAEIRHERESKEEQRQFYYMLNAFGMVMGGRKWKWQSPNEAKPVENFEERERAVLQRLAERRQRKGLA